MNDEIIRTVTNFKNGNKQITYKMNGRFHNPNGPAFIKKDKEGNLILVEYLINGKTHRDNAPAIIEYKKGVITCERYFTNGVISCLNGAALRIYTLQGVLEYYVIDGKYFHDIESYNARIQELKTNLFLK